MAQQLSEEAYQRKKNRNVKYNAEHTTRVYITLNDKTDADILSYIQNLSNKQGRIKELLRKDMEHAKFIYTKIEEK